MSIRFARNPRKMSRKNPLRNLVGASAVAITLAASAGSVQAAVIAQFSPISGNPDYKWVNNGPSNSGTGGHFFSITGNSQTTAHRVATYFSYLDGTLNNAAFIPAQFKVDAKALSGNPATLSASIYSQQGVDGDFSFIYTGASIANFNSTGITLVHNSNLLSGHFTGAWIQGAGGSGSFNLTPSNGGTLLYTSAYDTNSQDPGTQEFAWNILSATPVFGANSGKALKGFRGNGGGNFSANSSVPEPATWGLMIVGFGGLGVSLRARRRNSRVAVS